MQNKRCILTKLKFEAKIESYRTFFHTHFRAKLLLKFILAKFALAKNLDRTVGRTNLKPIAKQKTLWGVRRHAPPENFLKLTCYDGYFGAF